MSAFSDSEMPHRRAKARNAGGVLEFEASARRYSCRRAYSSVVPPHLRRRWLHELDARNPLHSNSTDTLVLFFFLLRVPVLDIVWRTVPAAAAAEVEAVRAGGHAAHRPPARVRPPRAAPPAARLGRHVRASGPHWRRLLSTRSRRPRTYLDGHA